MNMVFGWALEKSDSPNARVLFRTFHSPAWVDNPREPPATQTLTKDRLGTV